MSYTDNVANFLQYGNGDDSVSINDLEMVAPEVIQKVRSRPNSPLASRDASPSRNSPITAGQQQPLVNGYHNGTAVLKPVLTNGYHHYHPNGGNQSDLSDDEYIDTVDDSETETPFRPIVAAETFTSRSRSAHSATGERELFHSLTPSAGSNAEVVAHLNRAIERLNASVQQANNRINVIEQTVAGLRSPAKNYPAWWPFEDISPRLLAMIILWPLVVNRMMVWLQRKK